MKLCLLYFVQAGFSSPHTQSIPRRGFVWKQGQSVDKQRVDSKCIGTIFTSALKSETNLQHLFYLLTNKMFNTNDYYKAKLISRLGACRKDESISSMEESSPPKARRNAVVNTARPGRIVYPKRVSICDED